MNKIKFTYQESLDDVPLVESRRVAERKIHQLRCESCNTHLLDVAEKNPEAEMNSGADPSYDLKFASYSSYRVDCPLCNDHTPSVKVGGKVFLLPKEGFHLLKIDSTEKKGVKHNYIKLGKKS